MREPSPFPLSAALAERSRVIEAVTLKERDRRRKILVACDAAFYTVAVGC